MRESIPATSNVGPLRHTGLLRFVEHRLKTLGLHGSCERECICRPIDDPINGLDGVGRQPFPQCLDEREFPRHARFET